MNTKNLQVDVELNTAELRQLASDAFHEQLIDSEIFRSCLNCTYYQLEKNFCLFYKSNPPPKIIVFSCRTKAYSRDVPF